MEVKFFFDSYALVEIIKGNPNYLTFSNEQISTTIFNIVELYWVALNEFGETKAKEIYFLFKNGIVELDDEIIFEAIKFRKENKKKDLSYADCIGYIYAQKNKMIFLTGDKEFKDLPNVRFIK